jgi:hypothetical protein
MIGGDFRPCLGLRGPIHHRLAASLSNDQDAGWTGKGVKGLDIALVPGGPRMWGRREVALKK